MSLTVLKGQRGAAEQFVRQSGVDTAAVAVTETSAVPKAHYNVLGGDAYYIGSSSGCSVGFSLSAVGDWQHARARVIVRPHGPHATRAARVPPAHSNRPCPHCRGIGRSSHTLLISSISPSMSKCSLSAPSGTSS
ncbi:hypothetical protein [Amycolatopsis echigonensis]